MLRRVLHIDMDAFFASVEQVRDPSLVGKPLIIGGTKEDRRGVVSTASYEARKFGVHSAMPLATAKRLCPHGIFMRGTRGLYAQESRKVREVLETVTPIVQMASIDEAYLDITGSLTMFGGEAAVATYIKDEIRSRTGLPCTIAVSSNKLVSKVGSDEAKPDGFLSIEDGGEAAFLAPLPIRKLPGLGKKTCQTLERLGIKTLGDLAGYETAALERRFGLHAHTMQRRARGESDAPVAPRTEPKSIGRETTFSTDKTDWTAIERVLFGLAQKAMTALRAEGLQAQCVTLKVRYAGFETHSHARTLETPTSVDAVMFDAIRDVLPKARAPQRPVRLIGVSFSRLSRGQQQLAMFEDHAREKWERALEGVDGIRARHGANALTSARTLPQSDKQPSE